MRRRLLLLSAAIGAAAAVLPSALPSASGAPATHVTGTIDSSPAGFLGCMRPNLGTDPLVCIVATKRPDGQIDVTAMHDVAGSPLSVDSESAVVPASSIRASARQATTPWMQLRVAEGALPRTGAIDLTMWANDTFDITFPGGDCSGEVVWPLSFTLAGDKLQGYVANADVEGTVGGRKVQVGCDPEGFGTFFTGPTTGAWAYTG